MHTPWDGSPEEDTWHLRTRYDSRFACSQGQYSSLPSFLRSARGVTYFAALTKVAPGAYDILLKRTRLQGTFFMCVSRPPQTPNALTAVTEHLPER